MVEKKISRPAIIRHFHFKHDGIRLSDWLQRSRDRDYASDAAGLHIFLSVCVHSLKM